MDKIIRDIERLKRELWALQGSSNLDDIQQKLTQFQQDLQNEVTNHLSSLSNGLVELKENVETQVENEINSLTEFKNDVDGEIDSLVANSSSQMATFQQNVENSLEADFNTLSSGVNSQVTNFKEEVSSSISTQNQEISDFKDEVNQKLQDLESSGTSGASVDASNIITSSWISKLLTGQIGFGEKIVDKLLSADGYIKYASGLIIQWGAITLDQATNGTKNTTLPTPFSNSSYAVVTSHYAGTIKNDYINSYKITTRTSTYFTTVKHFSEKGEQALWIAIGF